MEWEIQNTILTSTKDYKKGNIRIKDDRITGSSRSDSPLLDLDGTYAYPGLINSHDHLIGSYSPAVLKDAPYLSWLSWDNQLKSSLVFSERQTLDVEDLYLLGAYKNIFGGTSTVMDHIPHFVGAAHRNLVPIRVLSEYRLSHSIGNYHLGWGDGPSWEYSEAEKKKIPYVTHIGEGLDDESKDSLRLLDKLGALGEYSVLIHGIPFGPKEIQKLQNSKATMVWCPGSNENLFDVQPPISSYLDAGIPVALGTDLALTGTGNIFQEMKSARKYFLSHFQRELDPKTLFSMVTEVPAQAFRISHELGSLEPGKKADILVLKARSNDPYTDLGEASWEDIVILTRDGKPLLLDGKLEGFAQDMGWNMEKIRSTAGMEKLVVGSPGKLLKKIQSILGYKKDLAFLPIFESIENEG